MAIKDVLTIENPLLKEKSKDINFFYDDVDSLIKDLSDTLHYCQKKYKIGRAIAAPQIGVLKKAVYMESGDETIVMINPVIIEKSDDTFEVWDSCFSAEVAFFKYITRHRSITVEYLDQKGNKIKKVFNDDMSELFQHEIDHLYGILFTDYNSDEKVLPREEWEKLAV